MAAEPVAAIIQARMGSSRFPGKALAPFAGTTVLQHMLTRLGRVTHPLTLIVATTGRAEDDAVVDACAEAGVNVFRGSADDVLDRFTACIDALPARPELILRICADRPLLCPVLVHELLDAYDDVGRPDYLSNNLPPSYPDGLDLELVRTDCLDLAHDESRDPYDREHVTPFVYRQPNRFRLAGLVCPFGNFSHVRLALDTNDDLDRLTALHARLPNAYDYRDVLTAVELAT
ncbi:MAG TPA: NTP transferase domain-containing protein [Ilumatobacteraceae bacterium]|jgi:spore coat polysaccharide biosynthesis protein SpsF|nr:NTP transferase domain-containing protein [Ilumatobacteraceae bacterium]